MTTQVPAIANSTITEDVLGDITSAFRASLHPDLITLAVTEAEDGYLVCLVGDTVEVLGPLPRKDWIDRHDHELPVTVAHGLAWQPCPAELARDLSPFGAWYVDQGAPEGHRYTKHTQGYQDALTAFLRSPEAEEFITQPWRVGRVPCLLLFPNGGFATAPDATAQPIVLPTRETNDAKTLRSHLDDLIMERTWPGSL